IAIPAIVKRRRLACRRLNCGVFARCAQSWPAVTAARPLAASLGRAPVDRPVDALVDMLALLTSWTEFPAVLRPRAGAAPRAAPCGRWGSRWRAARRARRHGAAP